MDKLKTVCVYCGASGRVQESFRHLATETGHRLAAEGMTLIYGGGRVGLMGLVADAVLEKGGKAVGIIPRFLDDLEIAHKGVSELIHTHNMHERKMEMAKRADAFLVLPGGLGTLDETFEILTWKQLKLHNKPIVLVNKEGYWDGLVNLLNNQVREGFVREEHLALFSVATTLDEAFTAFQSAPVTCYDIRDKWI